MTELSTKGERPKIQNKKTTMLNEDEDNVFQNPTTLKIFLYLRSSKTDVGTRETQRDLRINNPQTVSWHMDKLIDMGFVEKTLSTQYRLTKNGKELNDLSLPIEFPFTLIRGLLIPKSNLLSSFSILSFIVYIYLTFIVKFTPWIITFGILSLGVLSILIVVERIKFQRKYKQFLEN